MRDTSAALTMSLLAGAVGLFAWLASVRWELVAAGLVLVQALSLAFLTRAQQRKVAPLALAFAIVAILAVAPIVAARL